MRRWLLSALIVTVTATAWLGCRGTDRALTELQRVRSGALDIVLLSARGALQHGKDTFTIEFRSVPDGKLVDVGTVKAGASMPMSGMPMFGTVDVQPSRVQGRYTATSDFSMAGTWRLTLEWNGGASSGSVTFAGRVQ
jgi:hypothetical protein